MASALGFDGKAARASGCQGFQNASQAWLSWTGVAWRCFCLPLFFSCLRMAFLLVESLAWPGGRQTVAEAMEVMALVTAEMEQAAALKVPLVAEAKQGASWYEAK